jgi:glycosyltransferase involved in cell wall biosynthesis
MYVRAARDVLERHPDTVFLAAGGGDEQPRLEALARELGVDRSVRFLGARSDVPDVMAASDVGVLCSFGRIETFPLALLEFMASGKPVVSTNVGSVDQIVVDGETGFVIDEGDVAALARSLQTLVADPEVRARMGRAALERARSLFDVQIMVTAIEDVLAGALTRSRVSAERRPRNP